MAARIAILVVAVVGDDVRVHPERACFGVPELRYILAEEQPRDECYVVVALKSLP